MSERSAQVPEWLPSEQSWIDQLTDRVFEGEIVLLRALPRWGLSSVCASVAEALGDSAVVVEGRAISEANQKAARERIDEDVSAATEHAGCAQLIFDDYGRAIRRSQGGTLHSMLYRLLVDSEAARDTGALLVARSGDMLDLRFSGSPLISRARSVVLPVLGPEDAAALSIDLASLRRMSGESTWLARQFLGVSTRQGQVGAVEHLNNDRRRIVESLPPPAVEVLAGARAAHDCDATSREALLCLGSIDAGGAFEPARLVAQSTLLDEVHLRNPGWPADRSESVRRFADMLAGVEDAIWVDRYLFAEPSKARAFLARLRKLTSTRLRLLVSDDRDRSGFASDVSSALDGLENIQVRFMSRHDRRLLHDRHLVLPAMSSGFVLPTAGVILSIDDPGSAVSVPMPALAINFADCWRRGTRVFPGS
ncbi:hypothetical protein [Tessaracoccus lacteus]|uniref:Uncharacterized protein n=1 Tax=Tessaracoccus lacteus TaxID=3041766 RepID=A0ABY8PZN9_9ACTN|nr:hypothetical protein [Tessaracoccus sp. T21]WGT47984.1 hypothetical protein QH948_04245 [Tessaracoccus sp. T21]